MAKAKTKKVKKKDKEATKKEIDKMIDSSWAYQSPEDHGLPLKKK